MKTQRFVKHSCLGLLLLLTSAGVTQAMEEGIAGQKQLAVREGEATWIGQAKPHARHGAETTMAVGAHDGASRALIRFDLTTRMASYDNIKQAVLELTLADVKGTWDNQTFELYQVNDGRWGAESATWASADDSDIIMLGSGEPIRTAWNQPGCEGWSAVAVDLAKRKTLPRIEVQATLIAKSKIPEPREMTPYRNALIVNEYNVEKVLKGTYAGKTIRVAQWGMLDLKPTPLAAQAPGTSVKLVLETFADHDELVPELISDTLKEDFDLKLYTDVNL